MEHDHEERHFKVTSPANVREAWSLIARIKDAERLLAEKQTEAVHEIGEQLEAAVQVLKENTTMVTGDKQARLAWPYPGAPRERHDGRDPSSLKGETNVSNLDRSCCTPSHWRRLVRRPHRSNDVQESAMHLLR
jgi:hypothetical protein